MPALELAHLDAVGLAALICSRDLGLEDVLEVTLARIKAIDPSIGAVALLAEDLARQQAEHLDHAAPFAGVPILVKDLGAQVAGLPQVAGCRYLLEHGLPASEDGALIRRYKAAGFLILGKTAVPEFGLNLTTEPRIGPLCRNPWDPRRSAGGSSGGAAAAVAAGLVPLAHATDAGGSIRVPAACCGLVGLKPGRDVMPQGPDFGNHLFGLASEHLVTRSVRDSAAVFALTRADRADRAVAVTEGLHRPPSGLRIALLAEAGDGTEIAPACREAMQRTAEALESLGHIVEPMDAGNLARDLGDAATVFASVISANLAYEVDRLSPPPGDDDLEAISWAAVERGRRMDAKAMVATHRMLLAVAHRMAARFRRIDVLLTPSLAMAPPLLGAFPTDHGDLEGHLERLGRFAPFAAVFNVSGQPALSLPAGLDGDGLPVGIQLAGPRGAEDLLLRLAGQLEQVAPWPRLAPLAEAGAAA